MLINDDLPRNNENRVIFDEIFLSTRKIITSISRKIRKEIYQKHRSCLKRMKKQLKEKEDDPTPYCPVAYAYLKCRKNVQGFKELTKVDNSWYYNDRKYEGRFDIASNLDRELIFSMINDLVNSNFSYNITRLVWIIQKIIAKCYLNHFYNILRIAINKDQEKRYKTIQNSIYNDLELILIKHSFVDNVDEIYWFGQHINIKNIIKEYSKSCPYRSVKQRRIKPKEKSFDPLTIAIERMSNRF